LLVPNLKLIQCVAMTVGAAFVVFVVVYVLKAFGVL
jgi:hypothetical protein